LSGTLWASSIAIAIQLGATGNTTIYGIWGLMVILVVGLVLLTRVHPRPAVIN
jgi:UMF1 family MFS transporter